MSLKDIEKGLARRDAQLAFDALGKLPADAQLAQVARIQPLVEQEIERLHQSSDWSKLGSWAARLERQRLMVLPATGKWSLFLGTFRSQLFDRARALADALTAAHPELSPLVAALLDGAPVPSVFSALIKREHQERLRLGYTPPKRRSELGSDVEASVRVCRVNEGPVAFRQQVDAWLKQANDSQKPVLRQVAFRIGFYDVVVSEGSAQLVAAHWLRSWSVGAHGLAAECEALFRTLLQQARQPTGANAAGVWLELLPLWGLLESVKPLVAATARQVAARANPAQVERAWADLRGIMPNAELAIWVVAELNRRNGEVASQARRSAEPPRLLRAPSWFDELIAASDEALVSQFLSDEHPEQLARAAAVLLTPQVATEFVERHVSKASAHATKVLFTPLIAELFTLVTSAATVEKTFRQNKGAFADYPEDMFERLMEEQPREVPQKIRQLYQRWKGFLDVSRSDVFGLALELDPDDASRRDTTLRFVEARGDAKSWDWALHQLTEAVGAERIAGEVVGRLGGPERWCSLEVLKELVPLVTVHGPGCTTRRLLTQHVRALVVEQPQLSKDPAFKPLLPRKRRAAGTPKPRKPRKKAVKISIDDLF